MRPERKGRCEDGAGVMRTQGQSEPHGCCNLGQEENEMLERTSGGGRALAEELWISDVDC